MYNLWCYFSQNNLVLGLFIGCLFINNIIFLKTCCERSDFKQKNWGDYLCFFLMAILGMTIAIMVVTTMSIGVELE